jgi:hypothetical protein
VTTEVASLILSIGVSVVGVLLIVWHWLERPERETAVSEEDRRHFVFQSIRRWVVAAMMFLLSIGLYAGSRMEPKIGGKPNMLFVQTWLWVVLLVFGLVIIALFDWLATSVYSHRQRKAMAREGINLIRDEIRIRTSLKDDRPRFEETDESSDA